MSYTPGPWTVDATKSLGAYGVWTAYATHPGHDGAGYPSQICSVMPLLNGEATREQRNATAQLIAAAPDLLSACYAINQCIVWQDDLQCWTLAPDRGELFAAKLRLVREALTKAGMQSI